MSLTFIIQVRQLLQVDLLNYALLLPVEHRPQTACLNPCLMLSPPIPAPCGAGAPLFPLVHVLPYLFPFTFSFLSLALPIFFFCPSLPFLPE